jgi:hypothetical protein
LPLDEDLEKLTRRDLLKLAAARKIAGRSRLTRAQLIDALSRGSATESGGAPGALKDRNGGARRGSAAAAAAEEPPAQLAVAGRAASRAGGKRESARTRLGEEALEEASAVLVATAAVEPSVFPPLEPVPGDERLVLMVVEPHWAHAYWEVNDRAIAAARERAGDPLAPIVLRILDRTGCEGQGEARDSFDIEVGSVAGNYYINLWNPGRSLVAEIGVRSASGQFWPVTRSNSIDLPRDRESELYEDRRRRVRGRGDILWKARSTPAAPSAPPPAWLPPLLQPVREAGPAGPPAAEAIAGEEALPAEAVVMVPEPRGESSSAPPPAAPLPSAAAAEAAEPRVADAALSSADFDEDAAAETQPPPEEAQSGSGLEALAALSSEALSSWGLAEPIEAGEKRLRVEVRADIVLYGRAAPGTELVIDGTVVKAREDGTFDLRFSLPLSSEPRSKPASASASGEDGARASRRFAPAPGVS